MRSIAATAKRRRFHDRKGGVRSDSGRLARSLPHRTSPSDSAVIAELLGDLATYFDDGGMVIQRLVARLPMLCASTGPTSARISATGSASPSPRPRRAPARTCWATPSRSPAAGLRPRCARRGVQRRLRRCEVSVHAPAAQDALVRRRRRDDPDPDRLDGVAIGALVVDVLSGQRTWERSSSKLQDARRGIGAGSALRPLGRSPRERREPSRCARPSQRARHPRGAAGRTSSDLDAAAPDRRSLVPALGELGPDAASRRPADVVFNPMATERLSCGPSRASATVAIPLLFEGERFGAYPGRTDAVTELEEQFLTTVAGLCRQPLRPARYGARGRATRRCVDRLTELPDFRAIPRRWSTPSSAKSSSDRSRRRCSTSRASTGSTARTGTPSATTSSATSATRSDGSSIARHRRRAGGGDVPGRLPGTGRRRGSAGAHAGRAHHAERAGPSADRRA